MFALRCLAYDNDTNREAIVEEGAIEALAELMEKGTEEQKEQATHALKHLVSKKGVAANSDRFTSPLMGYLRARINSENANVAAALNTLETVREGVVPFFHRFMKATDPQPQPVSIHQNDQELDLANTKVESSTHTPNAW
ncbi:hypothetical protein F443_06996 [Phytophthora nicotianae P1569]|uniref:Armadillo repeat-containing domain-containing protein n=1 Tax=Phytophthora nicotianae P1569 TaxID=1317065 RepID=V9FCA2_PHYNI|nr:hypothetical protein F443_06996 [Phytophthora nicotianae P1569]